MKIYVILLILLSASPTHTIFLGNRWVVWNVGQGQWVTRVEGPVCLHFDMGGEKFPWNSLKYFCQGKENQIFLSHWDWDHIGALAKFKKRFSNSCIALAPTGKHRRQKLLKNLVHCRDRKSDLLIHRGTPRADSNSQSHILLYKNFLIPGDSPQILERQWSGQFIEILQANVLILGHHGSRTSTSDRLLSRLPHLKIAIASARWKRYKHPHPEVVYRLKVRKIPLLQTEDWGHIHFIN